jgi:hypothetical protein
MCMIIVKKRGLALPKKELLRDTFYDNPDGSGFVYVRNGVNHLRKGYFNVDKWINAIYREVKPSDLLITHSRIMTSGVKDKQNTQPFIIARDYRDITQVKADTTKPVMAHNGVISDFGESLYSDTVHFISEIMSDSAVINNLKRPAIQTLIERSINSSRFVVVKDGELYLMGNWVFDDETGLLFSHEYYSFNWTGYDWYDDGYNSAPIKTDDGVYGYCDICGEYGKLYEFDGALVCRDCFDELQEMQDFKEVK